jgi:hypothetical protein
MSHLEHKTGRVSLAVSLRDDYAKAAVPRGVAATYYSVAGRRRKAIEAHSGYHVFERLAPGPLVLTIESDRYLTESRTVTLPRPAAASPELQVVLKPNWLYPFPAGATLIRGRVEDAEGPVEGVRVRLVNTPVESRTDPTGHFVLYYGPLTEDALTGSGLVKARDGTTTFRLRLTHAQYAARTLSISNIHERSTFTLSTPVHLTKH